LFLLVSVIAWVAHTLVPKKNKFVTKGLIGKTGDTGLFPAFAYTPFPKHSAFRVRLIRIHPLPSAAIFRSCQLPIAGVEISAINVRQRQEALAWIPSSACGAGAPLFFPVSRAPNSKRRRRERA
jgi:hypothetical protein